MERRGRVLVCGNIPDFSLRDRGNRAKTQSRQSVFTTGFEPSISTIQFKSGTVLTNLLGCTVHYNTFLVYDQSREFKKFGFAY